MSLRSDEWVRLLIVVCVAAAIAVAAAMLLGCDGDAPNPDVVAVTKPVEQATHRFKVEFQGQFEAGYMDHRRDILLITDTTNGHQYLGITGVGVAELWTETHTSTVGKHSVTTTKTVEE